MNGGAQVSRGDERLAAHFRGRRVCVTGGAGFIGSHLCDALVQSGAVVSVIDDLSNGRPENLAQHGAKLRLVVGSILDSAALSSAMDGAELVFHEGALCSVPGSVERPLETHEVNATGTVRVLEAARKGGVKRVVFAASSSAYGNAPQQPKVETMLPEPMSPYAVSKCAGEAMLRTYSICYGLSTISLRYFNIFGPRQRPDSAYAAVIPRWAEAMSQGRPLTIYGDGTQTRDFTHVSNVVHANLLAASCAKELRGEVVNIACGKAYSLLDLIGAMERAMGVKAKREFAPPRVGEVMHSHASIDAARKLIGYEPVTAFEEGLRGTVQSHRG